MYTFQAFPLCREIAHLPSLGVKDSSFVTMPQADPTVDLNSLNYTVLVPYNGSIATGGDSLADNLNVFYEVSNRISRCTYL